MNQRGLIGAEFHLAGLDFFHGVSYVESHCTGLRIRHQAAWAKHLTQLTDGFHHVRRGDDGVIISPVFLLDFLDHVVAADDVRSCRFCFTDLLAAGDDQHFF